MNINRINEISRNTYRSSDLDINKIIKNHDLNNDFYNVNNKSCIKYFCVKKLRVILISFIISIIIGTIIFIILYKIKKESKYLKIIKNDLIDRDGYYIPLDKLSDPVYLTCSVKNCKKCFGNSYNNTCISCLNSSYIPIKDENNKIISCEYNQQNDDNINNTNEYIPETELSFKCEPGFFLPEQYNIKDLEECKKCSVFGCENCYGNKTIDYCESCFSDYIPKSINDTLICTIELDENCINYDNLTFICFLCKEDYILFNGRCHGYSFMAEYLTNEDNQTIKLINLNKNYIEKIIINEETKNASDKETYINIGKKGYHKAYYFIINNPTSLSYLFDNCSNLVSVSFSHYINFGNIINLSYMFNLCSSLDSVKFNNFNSKNVINMNYMFSGCINLTSINLNDLNTRNVEDATGMFMNCYSLNNINLTNFNYINTKAFAFMFYNCKSLTYIILPDVNDERPKLKNTSYMF